MSDESPTTTRTRAFFRNRYTTESEWKRFYEKYFPIVQGWIRMWHAGKDSETVAQDVMSDLWLAFKKGSRVWDPAKGKRLRAWLRTVALHALLDYKDRFLRRRPPASADPLAGDPSREEMDDDRPERGGALLFDDELIRDTPDDADDPAEQIANQETIQNALELLREELIDREQRELLRHSSAKVESAVAKSALTAEQKFQAFSHWFERNWKAGAIARDLKVPAATVSRWLYDTKKIFREIVIGMDEPDPFPDK